MKTITLATLPTATAQEVFDHVVNHLLTQNKQSLSPDYGGVSCLYRGENGLKCGAGCIIADDEYNPKLEGRSWGTLVEEKNVPVNHRYLIAALQSVHDDNKVINWKQALRNIAVEFNLNHNFGDL